MRTYKCLCNTSDPDYIFPLGHFGIPDFHPAVVQRNPNKGANADLDVFAFDIDCLYFPEASQDMHKENNRTGKISLSIFCFRYKSIVTAYPENKVAYNFFRVL